MPNNTPKKKKQSPIITLLYVVGIALAVGGYVFTDASGYLIPGLSPLALAAVILTYTWQHYQKHKDNRDGMLLPQMTILAIMALINIVSGGMQIYAFLVS